VAAMSWWTEERVDELKARLGRGESGTEICVAMQAVSRNAVVGKAYRLRLVRPANFKVAKSARVRRPANPRPAIRKAKQAQVADESAAPVFVHPKYFMQLKACDCRFPGPGSGMDMLYCGAPALEGRPYCLAHCRIAYDGRGRR